MSKPIISRYRCCIPSQNTDKDYEIHLVHSERVENGWDVVCFYGRHGKTLNRSPKLEGATYERALKVYEREARNRIGKGYVSVGGAPSVVAGGASVQPVASGMNGQLLVPMPPSMKSDGFVVNWQWLAQEKYDGERLGICKKDGEVTFSNRKGIVIPGRAVVQEAVQKLTDQNFEIDGEVLSDDRVVLFDLFSRGDVNMRAFGYAERLKMLREVVSSDKSGKLCIAETAMTPVEKQNLLNAVRARGGEGVVWKRIDEPMVVGKRHSAQFKEKFWKDCSCVVEAHNDQSSVVLKMFDAQGQSQTVGNVTIPTGREKPPVGSIVDVRYLYAYRGGSLYQPTFKGVRTDVDASECTLDTLEYYTGEDGAVPVAQAPAASTSPAPAPAVKLTAEQRKQAKAQKKLEREEEEAPILSLDF